jgi:hypothetical protein
MGRTDFHVAVQPLPPQWQGMFGTDTFVGTFAQEIPWFQGVVVEISATGQIGSGVCATGLTPPGGWSESNVSGDSNWPFHGDRARSYSLIGTLNRAEDFFFVGTGKSFALTGTGATIPVHDAPEPAPPPSPPPAGWAPPTRTLALLVNRPQPNVPASAGDHQWDVTITVISPDWNPMTMTWENPAACPLVRSSLGDAQGAAAADACSDFTAAVRAVNDRWLLIAVAGGVAGAALVALITVAVAVFTAAAAARVAQENAYSSFLNTIIQNFLANPAGAPASLVSLMQSPLAIGTTGMTLDTLWAMATSGGSPLTEIPWMAILIGALMVVLGIAVAVAIGLLLSLLTLAADVDNDKSNFDALVDNVQSLLDTLADLGCGPPASTMLPTCPAIG